MAAHVGPGRGQAPAPLQPPALPDEVAASTVRSRQAIWLREHLDHLADNMRMLVEPASHLAEIRRRPWWR